MGERTNMEKIKRIMPLILSLFMMIAVIGSIPTKSVKAEEMENINLELPVNHELGKEAVTIVDESTSLLTKIASYSDEDYYPYSRRWNGMPTSLKVGKNLFVAWQTGGVREPDPDNLNYIVMAVSQDDGVTWKDPFMIINPMDESVQAQVPQLYVAPSGQVRLQFSYSGKGIHTMPLYNLGGDLEDIRYGEITPTGVNNSSFTKPTILDDGSIIYASGKADTYIFKSTDDGLTFQNFSTVEPSLSPSSALVFSESSIIQKENGLLWHLRRLENGTNGGIEQSFSADGGLNWTVPESDLLYPLQSPGSRFTMQRLQSGNILFITNMGGMGATNRTKMTAFLSEDDGDTWPYSLLLDPLMSSYPDFCEADGKIYAVFDKDRYGEGGVRLCVFTEEDVKAGKFLSEGSIQLGIIARMNNEYGDIKTVNGAFPEQVSYPLGTDVKEIIANYPTTITVTDDNGRTIEIKGKYRVSGYNKDEPGTYRAYFITENQPVTLKDSFNKLSFDIVLEEKSGCVASVGGAGGCTLICFMALTALAVKKYKR